MSTQQATKNAELEAAFASYLTRQGRAAGTSIRYLRVVGGYNHWLGDRSPASIDAAQLDRYLDSWQTRLQAQLGRPPAVASYRGQINALRAYYNYLDRFNHLTDPDGRPLPDPTRKLDPPKNQTPTNDWLRPSEDAALLACPGTLQERFLVALLRYSGLRIGEAASLTLSDLDLSQNAGSLTVRASKTAAGRRTIPIIPSLQPVLDEWLEHLESHGLRTPSTPLLTSRHGTPIRHAYAWRLVKRVAHRAAIRPNPCTCTPPPPRWHQPGCPRNINGHNLSTVTPHTLRRTFGSDLINRGLRLEVVSKLLGHATTTITEHTYAQLLDDTTRRELLTALNPTTK
jgi:integrase